MRPILTLRLVAESGFSGRVLARVAPLVTVLLGLALSALPLQSAPVRVGVEPLAEQLSHLTPDGKPEGFAVDIARAVAKEQGLDLEFIVKPWVELLDDFLANRLDALAAVGATPERDAYLAYTAPHVDLRSDVFLRPGLATPKSVDELRTASFGTTAKSLGQEYLARRGWTNLHYYPRLHDALDALNRGECDAVIAVGLIARQYIRDARLSGIVDSKLEISDLHFELRLGVHPEDRRLLYSLNDGLTRIRLSGEYDHIYEKWIGVLESRRLHLRDVQPYLIALAAIGLVVAGAFARQRRLMRQLARQTEELGRRQEQLAMVLEGSEDGFWDKDLTTGHIERSERWGSMLGYTAEEIERMPDLPFRLIHPDDLPAYEAFRARLDDGTTQRFQAEYRMRAKSGE